MSGSCSYLADNSPAKNVPVVIIINNSRSYTLNTYASNGIFLFTYVPTMSEGGSYTIGAYHPATAQRSNLPIQDNFSIVGMGLSPSILYLNGLTGNPITVK